MTRTPRLATAKRNEKDFPLLESPFLLIIYSVMGSRGSVTQRLERISQTGRIGEDIPQRKKGLYMSGTVMHQDDIGGTGADLPFEVRRIERRAMPASVADREYRLIGSEYA
jgi:hypothetical protein